jgi:trehalose-6-phosphate synthase
MGQIALNDHLVRADTFPMGIDFKRFNDLLQAPQFARRRMS